ncbi:hypothetical protein KAH37_08210 [bacterium]|nr:hypothetical protein [bacterium]
MNTKYNAFFSKFLKPEQVEALKEEIVNGIKKVNNTIEADKQLKARKESLKNVMIKIDSAIDSDSTPLFAKILYKTIKVHVLEIVEKIFDEEQLKIDEDVIEHNPENSES